MPLVNLAGFVLNVAILLYSVVAIIKKRRRGNSIDGTGQTKQLIIAVIIALLAVNFGFSLLHYLPFARGRYNNLANAGLLSYLSRASGILRISVLVFVSFEIVALLILGIRALVKKQRNSQATRAANLGYRSSTGGIVGGITTLILGVICIGGGIYLNYFYDSQRLNMGNYSFDMNENGIYATSKYAWMSPVATALIILGVVLLGLGIFFLIRRSLSTNAVAPQMAPGNVQQIGTMQQEAAPAAQIYCSQCGAQNPREGKFCKECGAVLLKSEQ